MPRDLFVTSKYKRHAWEDRPLPIWAGQTISQPYIVARTVELAEIGAEDRVLEVGAGSGYAAAVMGRLAGDVTALERHRSLIGPARRALRLAGAENVRLLHGDGLEGLPGQGPFDVIVFSAGGAVPDRLRDQLAVGGRIVAPLPQGDFQVLTRLRRTGPESWEEEAFEPVRFVPLRSGREGGGPPSAQIADLAEPFADNAELADLVDRYADRQVICLGESTHGSAEFYQARTAITERLVREHGFTLVATEADWPDAAVYDRMIRGQSQAPEEPAFTRFPRWMWRNGEVSDLLRRLRDLNRERPAARQVAFRGLDIYSLCASIDAVLAHLDARDPELGAEARERYSCLRPHCGAPGDYVRSRMADRVDACADEVVAVLTDLLKGRAGDLPFDAEQNARIVVEAEQYYRAMYSGFVSSWNLRDRHMGDTLLRLLDRDPGTKAVVWAHNAHVGDARATEMGRQRGEITLGQLLRERLGEEAVALIGFSTAQGEVAAAEDWGGEVERMPLRPPLEDSLEDHAVRPGLSRFLLDMPRSWPEALGEERLQRAVGVVYRPETERASHYFRAVPARQFDAWIFFETTRPVSTGPAPPEAGSDLFPFGL